MPGATAPFDTAFYAFSAGRTPFCWQRRLFDEFARGQVPRACALSTGLGKTSVIPIWLIALVRSASTNGGRPLLPRRLVYIINRRTVVDRATDDAKRLLGCIYRSGQRDALPWATNEVIAQLGLSDEPQLADEHVPAVAALRKTLSALSGDDDTAPLAVSTLRGELADNGEWKKNPARPAIIIGTIDMIGSKLLFSGYGDGPYGRTHHAGLIGQDTLVVHDEAHLSPAFSALLGTVEQEQQRGGEGRRVRVMELSATARNEAEDRGIFGLNAEDDQDLVVSQRRTAKKTLTFQPCDAGKGGLAKAVAARALTYRDAAARILVYVRSPDDAKAVAEAVKDKKTGLGKDADGRVCLLTGTIRGYERDRMAREDRVFRDFLSKREWAPPERTTWLVSTSAGEVGVDFDADHLVCDLSTLDSMAQRFGRVNRLGGAGRSAEVTVVCEQPKTPGDDKKKQKEPSPLDMAIAKTGQILRKVAENGGDVSPSALSSLLESSDAQTAFSPTPTILPATDILFDSWALTSIMGDLPGRPEVGPYLHGIADYEPPETYVAWRAELVELAGSGTSADDLAEMLDAFPIRAAERVRDSVDRVQEQLEAIAARHPAERAFIIKNGQPYTPKVGQPPWITLAKLAPSDRNQKPAARRLLAYATVLLPTEVGGLKDGMLNGQSEAPVTDVAEAALAGQAARQRIRVTEESKTPLLGGDQVAGLVRRCSLVAGEGEATDEDSLAARIEYRVAKAEGGEPGEAVLLKDHSAAVEGAARRIAEALDLSSDIAEVLALAGRWHDQGKICERWQKYACNDDFANPLAKAKRYRDPRRVLGGYRHEFGSLLDATLGVNGQNPPAEIADHPERDLILHLIAAHHGWARPHFRHDPAGSAYDPRRTTRRNQQAAAEAMRRFARLQRRFGRWGLAWLESLLRCADAMASRAVADGGDA